MMSQKLPSFWTYLWISILLAMIGWGGLYYLVFYTQPFLGPRWMFYFLLMLAFSGTALPVMYFLNRRFPSETPVDGSVVVREALWVGVYVSLISWLQLGRVLNTGLAMALAVGLILVEFLLRLGEGSAWRPAHPGTEAEETEEEADA